jgi:hypothetical protein
MRRMTIHCCALLVGASVAVASTQSPGTARPLRVWVFTKPDLTTMHYDEWRLRDNAVIYTKRLLSPQTVLGGYQEEARRALPLQLADTENDAQILMEVVSLEPIAPQDGTVAEPPPLQLTVRVTAEGLKPTDLQGQSTITHGAVLDMLKQFDKWLKDNAIELQRLERRPTGRSGAGGPS